MNCLLNQTYKNIEFICINDGSQDSTLEELERFSNQDSRIKIYTKENQKYAQYSKAFGQEKATGDYIFLFDHDDIIDLDTIEKCLNVFEAHPEIDIVTPMIDVRFTNGKRKYLSNLNQYIKSREKFAFRKISGKEAITQTVGRYDIHIRGLYKKEIFKSYSFSFTEPLLNADEIIERLIFEKSGFIGSCNAVYTHYIHPDSSAKLPSIKKIDIARTDILLREIFKSKNIYSQRKNIFEMTAYKNLINSIKTFRYFSGKLSKNEKEKQYQRLLDSYKNLDRQNVISQFAGLSKLYHRILLSDFGILIFYYKLKS